MKQTLLWLDLAALMLAQKWPFVFQALPTNHGIGTQGARHYPFYLYDLEISIHLTIRYPQEVSPWLNLTKLMTPTSWSWTFVSLISIVLYFNCTTFLVKKWMDGKTVTREIALFPFRLKKLKSILCQLSTPMINIL